MKPTTLSPYIETVAMTLLLYFGLTPLPYPISSTYFPLLRLCLRLLSRHCSFSAIPSSCILLASSQPSLLVLEGFQSLISCTDYIGPMEFQETLSHPLYVKRAISLRSLQFVLPLARSSFAGFFKYAVSLLVLM